MLSTVPVTNKTFLRKFLEATKITTQNKTIDNLGGISQQFNISMYLNRSDALG